MKHLRCLAFVLLLLSGNSVHALPEFDTWIESFAHDWVKSDPMTATRAQYLTPAEQDAGLPPR